MTPLTQIKIALIILIFAVLSYFVYNYNRLQQENKSLLLELKYANNQITVLDEKAKQIRKVENDANKIIQEIDNTPETDDGNIAPILLNTINRLYK